MAERTPPENTFPHRCPFLAKGARINHCKQCQMPEAACICDVTPDIDVKAHFYSLMFGIVTMNGLIAMLVMRALI